jgi:hypothetical protein
MINTNSNSLAFVSEKRLLHIIKDNKGLLINWTQLNGFLIQKLEELVIDGKLMVDRSKTNLFFKRKKIRFYYIKNE